MKIREWLHIFSSPVILLRGSHLAKRRFDLIFYWEDDAGYGDKQSWKEQDKIKKEKRMSMEINEMQEMNERAKKALEYHKKGYNCSQAVACSFCEEFGVDEETMFRIAEGFGFGMGMMDICGAVTGMFMVMGLDNSVGNPDNGKLTKADTYKKVKEYANRFKEKNGTYYCRELKSVVDGKQRVSCDQCILDAVALTESYLANRG